LLETWPFLWRAFPEAPILTLSAHVLATFWLRSVDCGHTSLEVQSIHPCVSQVPFEGFS
jgi:hypothetical protein